MKAYSILSMFSSSSSRQFFSGTGAAFLIIIAGKGVSYLLQLVFARVLGVDGYGVYIYVVTVISILSIFSTMGFDSVPLKYLAMYRLRQEWSLFSGILRRSLQIPLSLSVCTAVAVIIAASSIDQISGNRALYSTLIAGTAALPLFTLLKVLQSVFRSQKQIISALLPNEIAVPFFLLAGVGGFSLMGFQPDSLDVITYHAIVIGCVLAVFSFVCCRRLSLLPVLSSTPRYKTGEWTRTAASLLLISGMHIVLSQTDIMLLGVFKGTTDAGIYAIASKIAILVTFGLQIGNQIIAPMISEFYHDGDKARLQEVVSLGSMISTIFAVIIVLIILFFARPLLHLFGPEFTGGRLSLYILAGGQMANALVGPVGLIMTMTKHHREASFIISVSALVNIVLNLILIPRFGMTGAAVATTMTMLSWNIAFWLYIRKNLGINTIMTTAFMRRGRNRS
ncbi:MAG: flippase [Desulfobulbaceae bacterium]|nr:flippase [Desulfobulbaceae bacterium]